MTTVCRFINFSKRRVDLQLFVYVDSPKIALHKKIRFFELDLIYCFLIAAGVKRGMNFLFFEEINSFSGTSFLFRWYWISN